MSTPRRVYRQLRRAVNCALGRDLRLAPQTRVPAVSLGTEYGAWSVCPRHLTADAVVYAAGIGTDISFDLALIERYGVAVHAFDPTPASIAWLESQQLPDRFAWRQVGLAAYDGQATFFPPDNPAWISHSMLPRGHGAARTIDVDVRRVSTLMRELGHTRVDLLKMDIEGAEYDVIEDILASGVDVGQLLIEFHHRFAGVGVERTRRAVARLNERGYRIFAVSESGEEYSFIRAE